MYYTQAYQAMHKHRVILYKSTNVVSGHIILETANPAGADIKTAVKMCADEI
jgi:hypothetical protein